MEKVKKFFNTLSNAVNKTGQYNLGDVQPLYFKEYSDDENIQFIKKLQNYHNEVIMARDNQNIPRYITSMDCGTMSMLIQNYLTSLGISSMLIIGDMKIYNELEYNTSYEYLDNELNNIKSESLEYHAWILAENYMIVDPTFLLKESQKDDFLNKKMNPGNFIFDIDRNMPEGIEYIPFLVNRDFLLKTNYSDENIVHIKGGKFNI